MARGNKPRKTPDTYRYLGSACDPRQGKMLQILDENGNLDEKMRPALSDADILSLYKNMAFIRIADRKALNLQRQGRMGTYAPIWGQEACQAGAVKDLNPKLDWIVPAFREIGAMYWYGVPLDAIYRYWMGDECGSMIPKDIQCLPVSIPVGSHMIHAVGIAWAAKIKGEKSVAMSFCGDGATSEGDFLEALNFAGVFHVPCIFIVQNNQWAISTPRKLQTASKTLAEKAFAFGFEGIQVDGNDIFAVYGASSEAIAKARSGNGPTLIECVTYRFGDHTTADDASRYRSPEEVKAWQPKDPFVRTKKYLVSKKLWSEKEEAEWQENCTMKVNNIARAAEEAIDINPSHFCDHMFATLPPHLREQKEALLEALKATGEWNKK
jgi:pyruvate dehydrogenase E1 component alpha subunit